ncbi:uncharacterized protein AKAME5_001456800 [Lates japonicus]|uniref:DBF4-type domain-containing protein n=1 Tax=Lates japonicus TaxID=270547 RepID=A0AAD3RBH8_LATJO|nr:uncharacterized protein AKAME5_001456800 [Lates japonicus]
MHRQQYAEERGFLGKLCPGEKKLEGKTFYLDNVKKRSTALLLEAISLLGGRVESFLHRDVNFVVTGSQGGLKEERCVVTKGGAKGTNEEARHPIKQRESVLSSEKQRPGTPRPMVCGSRGKALLEKAIRNKERLQGSSVLANARSWGVKILYVDDVLSYLRQMTRQSFSVKHKRQEKIYTKQQGSHVVKAAALRSPYLKIEDLSRKYRPLHMQSVTFPSLCYLGRFSPFESPPPQFEKQMEKGEDKTREKKKAESSTQDKSIPPLNCSPSPWRPRKKESLYCECCHQPFTNLEEHLQSDQHRMFVLDPSSYSVVDQLVAEMLPGFNPNPSPQPEETLNRPPTPLPIQDVCELEPLTDVETERAVQALRRQSSSFNTRISSPTRGPLSIGPASPSPGVQFLIPMCIESGLIPNLATLSPLSSSDSDWDCELLSRLGPTSATPLLPAEQSCELDKDLLHRPCTWMHDTSYESRLHTVLQPSNPATSLFLLQLRSRLLSVHLTASHRGNHWDYVSIMLAVRCLLFAAVCARCAVTGLREWVSLEGRLPPAEEFVQPKRLLQQIHSQEELLHSRLDTRVRNYTAGVEPVHLAQSSFLVEAFGTSFILDLELNHNLLSTDYVERHYDEDGQPSQNMVRRGQRTAQTETKYIELIW